MVVDHLVYSFANPLLNNIIICQNLYHDWQKPKLLLILRILNLTLLYFTVYFRVDIWNGPKSQRLRNSISNFPLVVWMQVLAHRLIQISEQRMHLVDLFCACIGVFDDLFLVGWHMLIKRHQILVKLLRNLLLLYLKILVIELLNIFWTIFSI